MIEKMEFGEPLRSTADGSVPMGCNIEDCDLGCKCGWFNWNPWTYSNARASAYMSLF